MFERFIYEREQALQNLTPIKGEFEILASYYDANFKEPSLSLSDTLKPTMQQTKQLMSDTKKNFVSLWGNFMKEVNLALDEPTTPTSNMRPASPRRLAPPDIISPKNRLSGEIISPVIPDKPLPKIPVNPKQKDTTLHSIASEQTLKPTVPPKPGHARNRSMEINNRKSKETGNLIILDDTDLRKNPDTQNTRVPVSTTILDTDVNNGLPQLPAPLSVQSQSVLHVSSSTTVETIPRIVTITSSDEDFEPRAKVNDTMPFIPPLNFSNSNVNRVSEDAYSFFNVPETKTGSVFDDIPNTIQEVHLKYTLIPELRINETDIDDHKDY